MRMKKKKKNENLRDHNDPSMHTRKKNITSIITNSQKKIFRILILGV